MFCERSKKKGMIIDAMCSGCDGRAYNTLVIHTCYLDENVKALKKFVSTVRSRRQYLTEVKLYVDIRAAKKFAHELRKWRDESRGIDIEINAVLCNTLFHSKAYALLSFADDVVASGGLVLGSGNLTGNGVDSPNGNIESFLQTTSLKEIREFWKKTKDLRAIPIDQVFGSEENIKEFIVNEGCLIHIWSEKQASTQLLSSKYTLTESFKEKVQQGQIELSEIGFNLDQSTISKKYFDLPKTTQSLNGWKTNYLVETYLGYWVPKVVLDKLTSNDDKSYENFKETFKTDLMRTLESKKESILKEYDSLISRGIIQPLQDNENPYGLLESKISELCANESKLKRIYYGYFEFAFPYDSKSPDYENQLDEFYDDFMESIEIKKKKNKTMQKVMELIVENNRNAFNEIDVEL